MTELGLSLSAEKTKLASYEKGYEFLGFRLSSKSRTMRPKSLEKFKADLAPEQVQEVVDAFAALPKQIDTIVGFEHGTNVSVEGKSEGLTHCFIVTFSNEQGRDTYLQHPAHQAYVKLVKDRREQVIVFDY